MNNLKKLRNEHQWSTQALSKELNINNTTLNRLENGITALNDKYIEIFCDFYNVSADYLLGFTNIKERKDLSKVVKVYDLDDLEKITNDYILDIVPHSDTMEGYFYVRIKSHKHVLEPYIIYGSEVLLEKIGYVDDDKFNILLIREFYEGRDVLKFRYVQQIGKELYGYSNHISSTRHKRNVRTFDKSQIIGRVVLSRFSM